MHRKNLMPRFVFELKNYERDKMHTRIDMRGEYEKWDEGKVRRLKEFYDNKVEDAMLKGESGYMAPEEVIKVILANPEDAS